MERFDVLRSVLEDESHSPDCRQHQLSLRTLQRWIQCYHTEGLAGLSRKRRTDRGDHRCLPPELHQFVEGLALQILRSPWPLSIDRSLSSPGNTS